MPHGNGRRISGKRLEASEEPAVPSEVLDGQRGRGVACVALRMQPRAKEPRSEAISLREGTPGFATITAGARMLLTGHWLNHLLDFSFS